MTLFWYGHDKTTTHSMPAAAAAIFAFTLLPARRRRPLRRPERGERREARVGPRAREEHEAQPRRRVARVRVGHAVHAGAEEAVRQNLDLVAGVDRQGSRNRCTRHEHGVLPRAAAVLWGFGVGFRGARHFHFQTGLVLGDDRKALPVRVLAVAQLARTGRLARLRRVVGQPQAVEPRLALEVTREGRRLEIERARRQLEEALVGASARAEVVVQCVI